ncbi:MAG TPA: GGDEF domain-containing protein [Chloroflexi bacterium]|nr:GGDEF domain-containing protein [Chloroflexota bacterium]
MSDMFSLDQLTGLMTRAAFDEKFKTLIQTAAEDGQSLSLAFLDIDHFLAINTNFGHNGGDQVLQAIAHILQELAGELAHVARYGGDEFALIFPHIEREQAFLVLERVRAEIESQAQFGSVTTHLTVTAGIAAFPIDGSSENEILRKADQALYRAKKIGRNNVRLAYEEKMAPKTAHFTLTQLERLTNLAKEEGVGEAVLLREALDDLLLKYGTNDIES